jgi:hypothetical protein
MAKSSAKKAVKQLIGVLQASRRTPYDVRDRGMRRDVPDDQATEGAPALVLTRAETAAYEAAVEALVADQAYEYLGHRRADELLWRLVVEWHVASAKPDVEKWLVDHRREPSSVVIYFTVLHLEVHDRFELARATFLPLNDPTIPEWEPLRPETTAGGVVSVVATGTAPTRIVERARPLANHAVSVLAAGTIGLPGLHPRQRRFRLGDIHTYRSGAGSVTPADAAWDLEVGPVEAASVASQRLATLPAEGGTGVEVCARRALEWLDRARMTGDPLTATLFATFALEGLLVEKNVRLKGHALAFRRALLAGAVGEGFNDPDTAYFVYEQIRSTAVHGGAAPPVDTKKAERLQADVHQAVNQFLQFAVDAGQRSDSKLRHALVSQPAATELLARLQGRSPEVWGKQALADVAGRPSAAASSPPPIG